jgi:flagellar secretion chaperone FliS
MNPYMAYTTANNNVDEDNKPKLLLKAYQLMLDKIDLVKIAIQKKDVEKKYEELTKLTMAIEVLDSSLDMSQGDVAKNLSALYEYLVRRLTGVHASRDLKVLEECRDIVKQLNEGFLMAYNKERKEKSDPKGQLDCKKDPLSHGTV